MIDIEPVKNEQRKITRNFGGIPLIVHRIKYTLNPGEWESQDKTCYLIARNFREAERLLVDNLPNDQRFNISEMSDSCFEIHAISEPVKRKLYEIFKPAFEMKKQRLTDRLLGS